MALLQSEPIALMIGRNIRNLQQVLWHEQQVRRAIELDRTMDVRGVLFGVRRFWIRAMYGTATELFTGHKFDQRND